MFGIIHIAHLITAWGLLPATDVTDTRLQYRGISQWPRAELSLRLNRVSVPQHFDLAIERQSVFETLK